MINRIRKKDVTAQLKGHVQRRKTKVQSTYYTHISLVVDRSNSMKAIKNEMQNAINSLIEEQFRQSTKLTFTLTEFDTIIDDVQRMATAPFQYELKPRLATSLFDAVGYEIEHTTADIEALPLDARPERVLMVFVTDGNDNHSVRFTKDAVREMISGLRDCKNWDFQFLGVEESAWQGHEIGVGSVRIKPELIQEIIGKLSKELLMARKDKLYLMNLAARMVNDAVNSGRIDPAEAQQIALEIERKMQREQQRPRAYPRTNQES